MYICIYIRLINIIDSTMAFYRCKPHENSKVFGVFDIIDIWQYLVNLSNLFIRLYIYIYLYFY